MKLSINLSMNELIADSLCDDWLRHITSIYCNRKGIPVQFFVPDLPPHYEFIESIYGEIYYCYKGIDFLESLITAYSKGLVCTQINRKGILIELEFSNET